MNIEKGAGFAAKFRDDDFAKAGANIVNSNVALSSDIILKVRQPHDCDIPSFRDNSTLISFLYPARNKTLIDKLSAKKMNAFGRFLICFFFVFFLFFVRLFKYCEQWQCNDIDTIRM